MAKIFTIDSAWQDLDEYSSSIYQSQVPDISGIKFGSAKPIGNSFPLGVVYVIESRCESKDIFCYGIKKIVSLRVLQLIKKVNATAVEFFPIGVLWNNSDNESYFLMNVFDRVDCLNLANSVVRAEESNGYCIDDIYKLAIFPVDEKKHPIFFINDPCGIPLELCVSDELAEEMIAQGITGIKLIDIDVYKRGILPVLGDFDSL
jgi:hypothetical protein